MRVIAAWTDCICAGHAIAAVRKLFVCPCAESAKLGCFCTCMYCEVSLLAYCTAWWVYVSLPLHAPWMDCWHCASFTSLGLGAVPLTAIVYFVQSSAVHICYNSLIGPAVFYLQGNRCQGLALWTCWRVLAGLSWHCCSLSALLFYRLLLVSELLLVIYCTGRQHFCK